MFLRGLLSFILVICFSFNGRCQYYITKSGFIGFYSKTDFEDIQAENNQAYAMLDPANTRLAFAVLMKGFIFPKELMQEHFNENYVESDKYPKATFTGRCIGDMDFNREGIYQIVIKGELNLHGVTQPIETTAQIEVKNDRILGNSAFKLKPEDFEIQIPGVVRDKIAREINVKIQITWMRAK
jgi:polyisoprenoid-binding protein YceI